MTEDIWASQNKCFFLRLEDPSRSSEAGRRKTSEPASPPVEVHETAVAWLRSLLSQSTPRAPAEETRDAYLTRLREACAHVNDNFDVAGLNRELPGRVQQLLELKGDKLRK